MKFKNYLNLFFQKALYPYSKFKNIVSFTHERDSKLLIMYYFDCSNHRDVKNYFSENLNIKW